MKRFSFLEQVSRAFHDHPHLSRLIILSTLSGGGIIAYAEANASENKHVVAQSANVSDDKHAVAQSEAVPKKKKVVVLGTGWAGTSFLKNLKNPSYEVDVVSPRNYFAFTPLLPSVTCGTVEPRSIVEPVRNIIRKKGVDIRYWEAECVKIDPENHKIYCRSTADTNLDGNDRFAVDYDYLVIAIGARVNTFNTPGVEENCHYLKEVEDAQKIRRTVIDAFEKAALPNLSDEERKKILHFVVVGGGPTGVEFAAQLHDFVNEDLVKLYPMVKDFVKITLVEATDHILNMFDKRITGFAEDKFQRDGIDVKLGSMVVKVTDKDISTKAKSGEITSTPYGMVLWSTGIGTRPVVKQFMQQIGQGNRRALATDEWLRVEGCDNIYALGDCATINQRRVMEDIWAIFKKADKDNSGTLTVKEFQEVIDDICERYPQVELYLKNKQMSDIVDLLKQAKGDGPKESIELNIEEFKTALSQVDSQMKNLPATAQVANQQGAYLARCFNRMEECEKNPEGPMRFRGEGRHRFRPFRYRHLGQFAPLGGEQTAAQLPGDWVSIGQSTQWLWYSVYARAPDNHFEEHLVVSTDKKEDDLKQRIWKEGIEDLIPSNLVKSNRIRRFGILVATQAFMGYISELELSTYALIQTLVVRFVIGILIGKSSATDILCGQAYGAGHYHMLGVYLQCSWVVDGVRATVLLPLSIFVIPILRLLGQEEDIAVAARQIALWFIPLLYAYAVAEPGFLVRRGKPGGESAEPGGEGRRRG